MHRRCSYMPIAFCLLPKHKISSEKQLFICSPDGADILPQSRRAREIKARAGQVVLKNGVWCSLKKGKIFFKTVRRCRRWWCNCCWVCCQRLRWPKEGFWLKMLLRRCSFWRANRRNRLSNPLNCQISLSYQ